MTKHYDNRLNFVAPPMLIRILDLFYVEAFKCIKSSFICIDNIFYTSKLVYVDPKSLQSKHFRVATVTNKDEVFCISLAYVVEVRKA